jgi:hypothetical protein
MAGTAVIKLLRLFAIVLGLSACTLSAAAGQVGPPAPRIVAIGDLHGDYNAYLDIVEAAGLADAQAHWTGGHTTLVQMGDVPDRGPGTLDIVHHLMKLEKAAAKAGGRVVVLIGNHEAMNMTGDLRYTTPAEFAAFADKDSAARRERLFSLNKSELVAFYRQQDPKITDDEVKDKWFATYPLGRIEHDIAWSPKGEIGKWVLSHPAIARIDGNLFVHGGISVETAARPIDAINDEVHKALAARSTDPSSIINNEFGPLWYRGNVLREPTAADAAASAASPRPSMADELTTVLKAYDATRLVVAHTPDLNGIEAIEGGRLIRVDTGITSYYGGPHSYLVLEGDRAVAHDKDKQGQWSSRALQAPQGAAQ